MKSKIFNDILIKIFYLQKVKTYFFLYYLFIFYFLVPCNLYANPQNDCVNKLKYLPKEALAKKYSKYLYGDNKSIYCKNYFDGYKNTDFGNCKKFKLVQDLHLRKNNIHNSIKIDEKNDQISKKKYKQIKNNYNNLNNNRGKIIIPFLFVISIISIITNIF